VFVEGGLGGGGGGGGGGETPKYIILEGRPSTESQREGARALSEENPPEDLKGALLGLLF